MTEQLAVNLLSVNMIQIKMGVMEYSDIKIDPVTFQRVFLQCYCALDTLAPLLLVYEGVWENESA